MDVDLPTSLEGRLFRSRPGKFLWLLLQPLFYSCRPLITNPKKLGMWEYINVGIVLTSDLLILHFCGIRGLLYLLLGTLLGMGLHPVAGHFVAEHYVLNPGFETVSYYGPLNWVTFNVGYVVAVLHVCGVRGERERVCVCVCVWGGVLLSGC